MTTTTALQSLALFNNDFILRQSRYFAERLQREASSDVAKQIHLAYALAFSREPTADEIRIAETHLLKPRNDATGKPLDSQRAKRNGYEDLLWALLNTKEFLYNH